jgi:hypothetical protein
MDIINNVTPFSVRCVVGNELPPTVVVGQLCVFKGMCYVGTDDEKWTLLSPIKVVTNIGSFPTVKLFVYRYTGWYNQSMEWCRMADAW